ncbi:hypothetical protein GCM10010191_56030 [Actinomadura vinacea]|uniref:Uncharacterized protein n=1 Tax=Actinomadura vinacea TaxID=115336 RepID=A0ABN3JPU6_9ACTN
MTTPDEPAGESPHSGLLRWVSAILANATVITAMLVYFGWQRSDVMAKRLGIKESILGMSTRDYVLRSVGQVLVLLLVVAIGGFLWIALDRWLTRELETSGRLTAVVLRLLSLAWLVFPAVIYVLGFVPALNAFAYIAFPFSIGAGVLLAYYGAHVGGSPPARETLLRGFVALSVAFALFWGTSHYATVLGNNLADKVNPRDLTKVAVYSPQRLHLSAPGVAESPLPDDKSTYRFKYTGLRLLDHTGGRYFLISDTWTRRTGTVIVLAAKDPIRLEFTHA